MDPFITDIAALQQVREQLQARWRAATVDVTEQVTLSAAIEQVTLSAAIEAVSLRLLALDVHERYPLATHFVLVESDQGDFMHLASITDHMRARIDDPTDQWGPEDTYSAAADLVQGSGVWSVFATKIKANPSDEPFWTIEIDLVLQAALVVPGQPEPTGSTVEHDTTERITVRTVVLTGQEVAHVAAALTRTISEAKAAREHQVTQRHGVLRLIVSRRRRDALDAGVEEIELPLNGYEAADVVASLRSAIETDPSTDHSQNQAVIDQIEHAPVVSLNRAQASAVARSVDRSHMDRLLADPTTV